MKRPMVPKTLEVEIQRTSIFPGPLPCTIMTNSILKYTPVPRTTIVSSANLKKHRPDPCGQHYRQSVDARDIPVVEPNVTSPWTHGMMMLQELCLRPKGNPWSRSSLRMAKQFSLRLLSHKHVSYMAHPLFKAHSTTELLPRLLAANNTPVSQGQPFSRNHWRVSSFCFL